MYAKILNSKSVIEIPGVILLFKFCIVLFENLSEKLYKLKHNFKLFFGHFVIGVRRPSIYSHLGRSHTVPPIGAGSTA